jgi:hypothetical protein
MPDGIDRRSLLRGASAAGGLFALPAVGAREQSDAKPVVDPPGREPPGAVFRAGAASRSIQPPKGVTVTSGGFGTCAGCPTRRIREGDDLRAGAFVVSDSDGENAVAVVKLDVQGWLAGYDAADKPGALAGRQRAATALSEELGLAADQGDVVIQATHSHAAPANLALWGTNPAYLQFLTDQVEAAVRAAAREAEPAVLEVGVGDIGYANNVVLGQPNSYEGWTKDTRLPVVRARAAGTGNDRPGTGRTIGIYAQMPAHENIIFGPRVSELSSGHFGAADRWLEAEFGGTAVVGPGTLGDQVTPMQGDATELPDGTPRSYRVVERLGALTGGNRLAGPPERPNRAGRHGGQQRPAAPRPGDERRAVRRELHARRRGRGPADRPLLRAAVRVRQRHRNVGDGASLRRRGGRLRARRSPPPRLDRHP